MNERRLAMEHDPGVELHIESHGEPGAVTVMLLHGFPDGSSTWSMLVPDLVERGYRVLVPTMRGYGRSSAPRGRLNYTLRRLVADLVEVIERSADGQAVHVVAHDWGGALSYELALSHPQLVRSLTLLNSIRRDVLLRAIRTNPAQRRRSSYVLMFQVPFLPEVSTSPSRMRRYMERTSPGTFSAESLDAMEADWNASGGLGGAIGWYRAVPLSRPIQQHPDTRGRIVCPTQLLWGETDPTLGVELAQPSIDICTDVTLTRIPDAGHWVHHDATDDVHEAVVDHLSAHGGIDAMLYKIVDLATWTRASERWHGTDQDRADGFIHLSAASQLAGTLDKWFERDRDDLLLLAVAPERLPAGSLHWEVSRNGQRFPHVYGALPKSAIQRIEPLRWEADHYGLPVAVRVRHNASA